MGDPDKRKWSVRPATSSALRYGLAVVSVAGAFGLAYTFLYFHLPQPFAAFALSAIAITFWYGGAKPGILAAVLASLVRSYFFTPEISTVSRVAYDLVFLLFALLMVQVTRARHDLEMRVAERTAELTRATEDLKREIVERKRAAAELRQSRAYLTEAQSLSHTGSFGWRPSTGEIIWSDETFRIMEYDRASMPTVEVVENRTHPEDRGFVHETIAQAAREKKAFDFEHRLMMPDDGTVKYVRVVGHPLTNDESGDFEFVGAVTDVTDRKQAEEALQRSEGYLAQAQRLTQSGSWAWNAHTGARFWSQETFRIFGYDPETVKPTWPDILERVHPEDRPAIVQKAITEATLKEDSEFDWRIVLPDGTVKHLHSIAHPVLDESGEITEVVGTLMDVTERKRAEALRDGESRILEMIARDAPLTEILEQLVRVLEGQFAGLLCSVLLLDKDGQHVRHGAGPSLPKAYIKAIDGLPIGPKAGSCGTAMYRKEPVVVTDILQDPLWEPYRAAAEPHGFRACWSTPILSPSGKALGSFAMYYREPRSPSQAESHALEMATHIAGIAIERKRTHRQLQRSEAYLAEAQRLSHSGSWAFNDREALYWSEENFRIWGLDPQLGLPDRETVLQRIHPEDRRRVVEYVQKAVRDKIDYAVEFRIVLPGGTVRHIHGLGRPIFNTSGELVEVVGTQLDITERKRAEEERERLRQLQADLARINRVTTMGELTASLAHEVNQPIAAAATDANTCLRWLTRDQPDIEEARLAAARIVKDATRAGQIVSRIREVFQKGTSQRALIDVNKVIQEMISLLRSEVTRHSVSVRTELADIPQVVADRVQLQQVLMNLMLNGMDAMKDIDGIRELVICSRQTEEGQLMVTVSDTGVGIPPQQADKIFNAFFTTKPQGTGLGLRISRSIIESHGGRLWACDNSPRGASFHLTLPTNVEARE